MPQELDDALFLSVQSSFDPHIDEVVELWLQQALPSLPAAIVQVERNLVALKRGAVFACCPQHILR